MEPANSHDLSPPPRPLSPLGPALVTTPPPEEQSPPPQSPTTYPPLSPSAIHFDTLKGAKNGDPSASAVLDVHEEGTEGGLIPGGQLARAHAPPQRAQQPTTKSQSSVMVEECSSGQGSYPPGTTSPPYRLPPSAPSEDDVRHRKRPGFQAHPSMRAGTQTLIQALSAVPWSEETSDDEGGEAGRVSKAAKGKQRAGAEESQPPKAPTPRRLASSLHTVHRPVALAQSRTPSQMTVSQKSHDGKRPHHHQHLSQQQPLTSSPESHTASLAPSSGSSLNPARGSSKSSHHSNELHFPFKENTVARHAKPLSPVEKDYQFSPLDAENSDARVAEDAIVRGEAGAGPSDEADSKAERERKASTETSAGKARKLELAKMLRDVFSLDEVEEVVGELACWLLRSVLLQGYMYLTTGHICFYAHLPSKTENKVIKSGPLSKKSSRKLSTNSKYWFILKEGVLSWYTSSADPYFPQGNVDLQYAIECESHEDRSFKVTTNRKSYTFIADTAASREEWVKAVRKVMFRTQHEGENVKIAIPLEAISGVDSTSTMDFAETIEIKVVVGDENAAAADSYFFAYFTDLEASLGQIKNVVQTYRNHDVEPGWEKELVYDTTNRSSRGRTGSFPQEENVRPSSSGFKIGSLLHPFSSTSTSTRSSPASSSDQSPRRSGEYTTEPIPVTSRRGRDAARESTTARVSTTPDSVRTVTPPAGSSAPSSGSSSHYPPRSADGPPHPALELTHTSSTSSWTPSNFIKRPSMKLLASGASGASSLLGAVRPSSLMGKRRRRKKVVERIENDRVATEAAAVAAESGAGAGTDMSFSEDSTDGYDNARGVGYSMMEKSETGEREEQEADFDFHQWFAMDRKEVLLEHFSGFLFRVVPVSGKVFISTNHFCFKATALLYKTKMVIPIPDIIALQPQKAFRFGHHGLAVVIKGHEELFLDFSSAERRDACKHLVEQQMDTLKNLKAQHGPAHPPSAQQQEAMNLLDLDKMGLSSPQRTKTAGGHERRESHSSPGSGYGSNHLPPVMFTSTESTFLDFKPKEPMHITCLTIGSRGDVQPYIALCKGLKAEGHRVRIASHGEYKEWIEGHGIEFGFVGGDPAELMRICIENGMFTVSFIKEGLNKFREWIDDLLVTSWTACQGTDLIIESPSAMGGIHIAEGLGVPYFRAFTMPWSRTRAYPHAFAVPDHHRGGSYNYMTYTMFDQVFWRAISGQINRWRKRTIGISSTNLDKLEPHKVPFLYNFSPTVVPPPLDWYEWIRITGYWFLDDPDDSANKKWSPPDGLIEFMDKAKADGKKIVYIGFGSIVVDDPEAMTACVIESVLAADVRVILSKGWSDRLKPKEEEEEGETEEAEPTPEEKAAKDKAKLEKERATLPAEVFPIASVPHDWLFPRIDAACHHGGAGTTGASLRAGIPTIILPFFGDQFFWADRVEVLGVGSGMRKLTQDHLTAALKTATTDEKQIRKAKALGEEIRDEKGVEKAIEAIYRDLEYARTLIKPRTAPHTHTHPHPTLNRRTSTSSISSCASSTSSNDSTSTSNPSPPQNGGATADSAPGSDESWDVVERERERDASRGTGSGSGSGGLGLMGYATQGLVGGLGEKLGIGK